MKFTKIDELKESINNLGFWEREIYEFNDIEKQSLNEILDKVLKSDILFETQTWTSYQGSFSEKFEIRANHSYTDEIRLDDIEKLNFKEYETRIDEIKKNEDWGEDLPAFIEFIDKSTNWIVENKYQNEEIFFIDAAKLSQDKLIESNFYCYLYTTVIISFSDSKVIIINHGGD